MDSLEHVLRRTRLVLLLHAAECAGIAPISVQHLHVLAFLSDVLAPVWDLPALEPKVLKKSGGPYYPGLQHDVDRMVGMGIVCIADLSYREESGQCRLEGVFSLNRKLADPILEATLAYPEYQAISEFVREVALALAVLEPEEFRAAAFEDATYADPMIDEGEVVDFAEWEGAANYSAKAALTFQTLMEGASLSRGETLHMYIRRVRARLRASE